MGKHCYICDKEEEKFLFISLNMNTCDWCHKNCCSNCTRKSKVSEARDLLRLLDDKYRAKKFCLNCYECYMQDWNKMNSAINDNSDVRYYSNNYQGKVETIGERIIIGTRYYRDREDAMEELRTFARFYGCNTIIEGEFDWEEREDEEENERGRVYKYRYKVWAYSGIAVNRVEKQSQKRRY